MDLDIAWCTTKRTWPGLGSGLGSGIGSGLGFGLGLGLGIGFGLERDELLLRDRHVDTDGLGGGGDCGGRLGLRRRGRRCGRLREGGAGRPNANPDPDPNPSPSPSPTLVCHSRVNSW